jgi:hypothetical protein
MKLAEKLVNKSIYLQILSRTVSEEILQTYVDLLLFDLLPFVNLCRFVKSTGYEILIKWLRHFHLEKNDAFLLDTLKILGELPFKNVHLEQKDINELHRIIVELESGEEKGQCFWHKNQLTRKLNRRKEFHPQLIDSISLLSYRI